jgi:hypothetical protein
MQSLFKLAGENGGARTRSAAGSKSIMNQYARTGIEKQSFAVRAFENWNRLSDWFRAEEKPDSFKRKLKKANKTANQKKLRETRV